MENISKINKLFQLFIEYFKRINQEIKQNVSSQIQNFQNNFEKLNIKPPEKHLLDNNTSIQYKNFSMPRLNINHFSDQMLQLHKSNSPDNNLFLLKKNGYSYKANFPYFYSNFYMTFAFTNFKRKKQIFKIVEPRHRNNLLNIKRKNNNKLLYDESKILIKKVTEDYQNENKLKLEKQDSQSKETSKDTINNGSNSIITEKNDNILNTDKNNVNLNVFNKPLFVVYKKSSNNILKGRRPLRINKRIHRASDDDNIMRKIQVHFLSFVINFLNDIIKTFLPIYHKDLLFKNIDYQIKKTVNHANVENLKKKTVVQLLQLEISPKNKNYDRYTNSLTYIKVCNKLPFMKNFMDQGYLNMFNNYYFSSSKVFIINGKLINLSERTKIFSDLLNRNYPYKERIRYVLVNYFLFDYKKMKKHYAKLKK